MRTTPVPPDANRLAATLLALLRVDSPTGSEAKLADEVEARLRRGPAGPWVTRLGDAVLVLPPQDERPCIALVGHLDTVPAAGCRPAAREGGRIWGRGASDMKGGLACMLDLAERLAPHQGAYRRSLVFYDREEGPYADNGLEPLLARWPRLGGADAAVVLEPTAGRLALRAQGSLHVWITVRGQAAHSGRPWLGRNAVHAALPLLARLAELAVRDVEVDGLTYREALSITQVRAWPARNVVPDLLEANANLRFAPGASPAEAFERLLAWAKPALPAQAELRLVDRCPAAPPFRSHPILDALRRSGDLEVTAKQAWTDVARLTAHGLPAANLGPGDPALAHRDDEHVEVRKLEEVSAALERFVLGPAHS